MRHFFISLGVTCLVCVVLFLYFRNRIGRMEQKVDLMFQLIQEYEQNKIIERPQTSNSVPTHDTSMGNQSTEHLISVSDDESYYSDSDEVSDEEDDLLNIKETVMGENIKSISLSGAEIESLAVKSGDNLDDISDLEETNMDDMITLEEEQEATEATEQEATEATEQEAKEHETNEYKEIIVKKVEVESNKPLNDRTVKELKQIAEEKGFVNYKGLRKNKLVELLTSQ